MERKVPTKQNDYQKHAKTNDTANENGLDKNNTFMKNMSLKWQEFYQAIIKEITKS